MKGEDTELGTKGGSASSVLVSSGNRHRLGSRSHRKNFEHDFCPAFLWINCYLLPFHPHKSDIFQEKYSALQARFTGWTLKAETCLAPVSTS